MNKWLRLFIALLSGAWAYFLYIYLIDTYLLDLTNLIPTTGPLVIDPLNFPGLAVYIQAIGYLIVAANFSHSFAPKGSHFKAIWRLLKAVLKIVFWSIFIFVEFDTLGFGADFAGFGVHVDISITILFYAIMGGVIFEMILAILDFLIAFFPPKVKDSAKSKAVKTAGGV